MKSRPTRRSARARRARKSFFRGRNGGKGSEAPFFQVQPSTVQTRPGEGRTPSPEVTDPLARRIAAQRGAGHPLPSATRARMERGLGADFNAVRLHTDSEAAALSRRLQAQAFTHGTDVFFNAGKYSPDTREGRHLLAHELTHTLQQGATSAKAGSPPAVQKQEAPPEQAAPTEAPDKDSEAVAAPPALDRQDWASRVKAARLLDSGSEKAEKEKQYKTLISEAATQFVAGYQGSGNKADIEFYLVSAILRHGDTFGKDVFLRALQGIAPIVAGANGNSRAMKFLPSALSFVELTIEDILGTAKKNP